MKKYAVAALAATCLSVGMGLGYAAKVKPPGMSILTGKAPEEAAMAALQEAERLAEGGTYELIGIGRVFYLSGDKERGQAMFDRVLKGEDVGSGEWFRIARIYSEAGEFDKAEPLFLKALAEEPGDDSGQAEVGAWYLRQGKREQGEQWLTRAFSKNADEFWHYVRAAEGYMKVPAN